jgi:NAD(P)-dependent dehydrogenase (short-subunit alcohol dehydrogenase family)
MNGRGVLQGEIAVVTGGTGAIGEAIARRLAEEGAAVAIVNRRGEASERTAAALIDAGHRALPVQCDVRYRPQVRSAVERVIAEWGRISILVNTAGITMREPFLDVTDETWNNVLAVNLTGMFMMSQEVARRMARSGGGAIVNMGSIAAHLAHSSQSAYATSKAGIEALTRAMAFELAPMNIRVNAIAPGTILTPFLDGTLSEEARAGRVRRIPMGRLGTPEDCVGAVVFLASRDAQYLTGCVVTIDGGLLFAGVRA